MYFDQEEVVTIAECEPKVRELFLDEELEQLAEADNIEEIINKLEYRKSEKGRTIKYELIINSAADSVFREQAEGKFAMRFILASIRSSRSWHLRRLYRPEQKMSSTKRCMRKSKKSR